MSLRRTPHTLSVSLPDAAIQENILMGYSVDPQGSVMGQLTPSTTDVVYGKFGVEITRAWLFLCDVADAAKFEEGGTVSYDGRDFSVAAAPKVYSGFGRADNCEVALSEVSA